METVLIRHPLRDIIYSLKPKEERHYVITEAPTLRRYVLAHNTVWQMKVDFEKEKGEVMLAYIELDQLTKAREELEDLYEFYKPQLDFTNSKLHIALDIKLQVELRDFYIQVIRQQQELVRFYDRLGPLDRRYSQMIDTYFRGKKPIDPLNFTILDDIFTHHVDRNVEITTLDKDLQNFLETINDVYTLLDKYVDEYNILYRAYLKELEETAALIKTSQSLHPLWESK